MTVYVVQEPLRVVSDRDIERGRYPEEYAGKKIPVFDVRPARAYGNLCVLLDQPFIGASTAWIDTAAERLRTFCDDDYIVPTGDPAAIGVAVALALRANNGRVKLLSWQKPQNAYSVVQVVLPDDPTTRTGEPNARN